MRGDTDAVAVTDVGASFLQYVNSFLQIKPDTRPLHDFQAGRMDFLQLVLGELLKERRCVLRNVAMQWSH
jgi:hypothetical protein